MILILFQKYLLLFESIKEYHNLKATLYDYNLFTIYYKTHDQDTDNNFLTDV